MYIDYNKIFSFNAFINMIITERGLGKTYGISKHVIKDFINNGNQFAYLRRYKSELKESVPKFYTALNKDNVFPDHLLTSKGHTFYCDKEEMGYAMTLSTAQDLKSSNFSNVKYIIFDEFIIEEGQKKVYLKNEVFVFLNLIETIARMRDIKVFMLGNAGNLYTVPYFLYFDITIPYNKEYKLFKDNLILLYYARHNEEFRNAKKQTKFGKLVARNFFRRLCN